MDRSKKRRKRGRRCVWILSGTPTLWWAASLRRWIDPDKHQPAVSHCSVRYCYTRASALRAARGLARLGGGTLTRRTYKRGGGTEVDFVVPDLRRREKWNVEG